MRRVLSVCILAVLPDVIAVGAQERRLALVIGISDYAALGSLDNAVNDARRIERVLTDQAKFTVTPSIDDTADILLLQVKRFVAKIREGDVVMIYYAGHGVQVNGQNYLLPSDFPNDVSQLDRMGLSVTGLLQQISARNPALKILVIDACRNNPLKGTAPGLARVQLGNDINTYIEFAATDGKIATDDGLFARHLSAELARPGLGVEAVFRNVRERVATETKQAQVPISFSQLSGQVNFFFVAPAASGSDPLALLERTAAAMAQGDLGQTAALEALVRTRHSLAGTRLLRGVALRNGNFSGGDFAGASFTATDLSRSDLTKANLVNASLVLATLTGSRWLETSLTGATLAFADLGCGPSESESCAKLTGVRAPNSRWLGADARGADFTDADLSGADLSYADLRQAKFAGANLKGASFIGSDLRGATFTGATLENTDFGLARMDGSAALKGACATKVPDRWNGLLKVTYERFEGRTAQAMIYVSDKWAPTLPACAPAQLRDDDRWSSRVRGFGDMSLRTDYGLIFDQDLKKRQGLQELVMARMNRLAARLFPVPEGTYRAGARTPASTWPPPVKDAVPPSSGPETLLRVSGDTIEILVQGKPVWRGRFERQPFEVRSEPNTLRVADDGTSNLCGGQSPGEWTQTWFWLSQTRFFFAYDPAYGRRAGPLCPARDAIFGAEFELVRRP